MFRISLYKRKQLNDHTLLSYNFSIRNYNFLIVSEFYNLVRFYN